MPNVSISFTLIMRIEMPNENGAFGTLANAIGDAGGDVAAVDMQSVSKTVTSVTIGAHWDVSWHRSIGRDSFWTPAHMAIYACGVLAGICCGYLILTTTFKRPPEMVAASVRALGFRGPLGAFLAAVRVVPDFSGFLLDGRKRSCVGLGSSLRATHRGKINLVRFGSLVHAFDN